jgi:copper homeostasis protein
MKSDIEMCKQLGCDGVVFGLLEKDGTIDLDRTEDLVELAYPMETTFHRAFDRCHDPLGSMEEIISIGCTRILTSGQKPTVMEGINLIAMLVEKAHERIIIMPGSGIRSDNIEAISKQTGATEFHSSARIIVRSEMEMLNAAMNETLTTTGIDTDEIKKMVARLKK